MLIVLYLEKTDHPLFEKILIVLLCLASVHVEDCLINGAASRRVPWGVPYSMNGGLDLSPYMRAMCSVDCAWWVLKVAAFRKRLDGYSLCQIMQFLSSRHAPIMCVPLQWWTMWIVVSLEHGLRWPFLPEMQLPVENSSKAPAKCFGEFLTKNHWISTKRCSEPFSKTPTFSFPHGGSFFFFFFFIWQPT